MNQESNDSKTNNIDSRTGEADSKKERMDNGTINVQEKEGKGETEKETREEVEKEAKEEAEKETREEAKKEVGEEAEKEIKEKAKKEAKEKAKKEAKEKAKKEAKEKAPKETKEKAPKETKEKARKETKERNGNGQSTKDQEEETNSDEKHSEGKTNRKTGKKKKILIPVGIFVVLAAACICAYSVIAYSYQEKFLPGTWINGIDCAEMDGAQVAALLENQLQVYRLEVTGRDYASGAPGATLGQVTAEDIHLTYGDSSRETVNQLLTGQNCFTWLYRRWSDNTYSFQLSQGVSYDEDRLRSTVSAWEACQPGNMTAPRDARISEYSDRLKGYEVIPETEGTKFDVEKLLALMDAAILSQDTSLDLEEEGCYEAPAVRRDAAELTEPVETANKWLGARITYDWNGAETVVDAELLKDWITMEKDGAALDETAVAEFVKEQAEANDTYGKRRSFLTTLGVELSLPSGYYGWLTDQEAETEELIRAISQGKTVSREPVYASTARQKGMSDIGNSYVEVDLTHQHLYLYVGGSIIFETDFVSGSMSSTPDCVTPEGVFGIAYKTTNAVLRGANYETPVNYWMPFYGNYGLHDATWRSEFGGQIYITDGSHGCVNLPLDAAATIYGHMSTGFPVICYYYQVDPLAQPVEENWDDDDEDEE